MYSTLDVLVQLLGMGEVGLRERRVGGLEDGRTDRERGGGGCPEVGAGCAAADGVERTVHGHVLGAPPVGVVEAAVADLGDEHRGVARDAVRFDHVVEGPAQGCQPAVVLPCSDVALRWWWCTSYYCSYVHARL